MKKTELMGLKSRKSSENFFETNKTVRFLELYGTYRLAIRVIFSDGTSQIFGESTRFRGSFDLQEENLLKICYSEQETLSYLCIFSKFSKKKVRVGEAFDEIRTVELPDFVRIVGVFGFYSEFVEGLGLIYQENYQVLREIPLEKPTNIVIIRAFAWKSCEVYNKCKSFLKDFVNSRFVKLPNARFPSQILRKEAISHYLNDFLRFNRQENCVIWLENEAFSQESLDLLNFCLYFPPQISDFQRKSGNNSACWQRFLGKSMSFLSFFQENLHKFPGKLLNFQPERLKSLPESGLQSLFQRLISRSSLENSWIFHDFQGELQRLRGFSRKVPSFPLNFLENSYNSYVSSSKKLVASACDALLASLEGAPSVEIGEIDGFSRSFPHRAYFINKLFDESACGRPMRTAFCTGILKGISMRNTTFACDLCVYLRKVAGEREIGGNLAENKEFSLGNLLENASFLLENEVLQESELVLALRVAQILENLLENDNTSVGELIESQEFQLLCRELLGNANFSFKLQGNKLFFKAFSKKPYYYTRFCEEFEEKVARNREKIASSLLKNLVLFSKPCFLLETSSLLLQNYVILLENHAVLEVSALFEHSFLHCSLVKPAHLQVLLDLLEFFFVKLQEFDNTSSILAIFQAFLKGCAPEITGKLLENYKELLSIATQSLSFFVNLGDFGDNFKKVWSFHSVLLQAKANPADFLGVKLEKSARKLKRNALEGDFPCKNEEKSKGKAKSAMKIHEKIENLVGLAMEIEEPEIPEQKPIPRRKARKLLGKPGGIPEKFPEVFQGVQALAAKKRKLKSFKEDAEIREREFLQRKEKLEDELRVKKRQIDELLRQNQRIEREKLDLICEISQINQEKTKENNAKNAINTPNPHNFQSKLNEPPEESEETPNELGGFLTKTEISEADARIFIENLQKTRKNLRVLRSSFCGALRFLSTDLYTSPTHFLYEMIQNFEDNSYATSQEKPFLQVFLHENYLLFCNNERGFLAKDVAALCGIGQSTKTRGKTIGYKGVGFKSVFTCTDNPQIISNPWRFSFRVHENSEENAEVCDELQYITPYWLEEPPQEIARSVENSGENVQTSIFLPFKPRFSKEKREDFLDQIKKSVEPNLLITLRTLQKLHIVDMRSSCATVLAKASLSEEIVDKKYHANLLSLEKSRLSLTNSRKSFLSFSGSLYIPCFERTSQKSQEIARFLVAFPLEFGELFGVYAGFPLEKEAILLPFLVNCDWDLTTSRESIKENDWNFSLRNAIALLIPNLLADEPVLRTHFSKLLPKQCDFSLFWQRFIHDFYENLNNQQVLQRLFDGKQGKTFVLWSDSLEILTDKQEMQGFLGDSFEIIEVSGEFQGVPRLCIRDIVQVLTENKRLSRENQEKWWESLFHLMKEGLLQGVLDEELVLKSRVFKRKSNNTRDFLKVSGISPSCSLYFVCGEDGNQEKIPLSWRKDLVFLTFSSESEQFFLTKSLKFPRYSSKKLLKSLLNLHLSLNSLDFSQETVYKDLIFFRNHREKLRVLYKNLTIPIIVPSKFQGKYEISRLIDSVFPTILGSELHFPDNSPDNPHRMIEFPIKLRDFSLEERLDWESFFVEFGSQLPPPPKSNEIQGFFPGFHEKMLEIIEKRPEIAVLARHLKVNCESLSNCEENRDFAQEIPDLKDFYSQDLKGFGPIIRVPERFRGLAAALGVTVEANFELCLRVLHKLAKKKEIFYSLYAPWLVKLQALVHVDREKTENFVENGGKSLEILYLEGIEKTIAVEDVVIYEENDPEEDEIFAIFAKNRGKVLISRNENWRFFAHATLFKALGALNNLSLASLVDLLNILQANAGKSLEIFQKTLFFIEKPLRILLEIPLAPLQSFPEIKKLIEKVDFLATSLKISHEFPLISHTFEFLTPNSLRIASFSSFLQSQILSQSPNQETLGFCDISLAKSAPGVLGLAKAVFIESFTNVVLSGTEQKPLFFPRNLVNLFKTQGIFGEEFRIFLGNPGCVFLEVKPPLLGVLKEKYKLFPKGSFVCAKDWLLLIGKDRKKALFEGVLAILEKFYEEKQVKNLREIIRNVEDWGEEVFRGDKRVSCEEVVFADDCVFNENNQNFEEEEENKEINFNAPNQKLSNDNNNFAIKMHKNTDDNDAYTINNTDNAPIKSASKKDPQDIKTNDKKNSSIIVNSLELKQTGIIAEYFFYQYLQRINSSITPENWVSSARLEFFPNTKEALQVSDSLGYDLQMLDISQSFKPFFQGQPVQLLFEVKGFRSNWCNQWIMSQNELEKANQTLNNPLTTYYIAIVQQAHHQKSANLAALIEWTHEKMRVLRFETESFKVHYVESEFCADKFLCKLGLKCSKKHSEREKRFFVMNGRNNSEGNHRWKTAWCRKMHRDKEEWEACTFAHDEEDAFCWKCKRWAGHVSNECG